MAIQVLSGASNTILTVDTVSNAGRVTLYDQYGNPMSSVTTLGNILNGLNAVVTVTLGGQASVGFNVGSTTGTLTLSFEATIDNSTWVVVPAYPVAGGPSITSTTANGQWVVSSSGYFAVRARVSAFTSGSMTVSAVATPGTSTIATTTVVGSITANQGTGAGAAAPWSTELSDGAAFYTAAKTGQFPTALVGGRLDTNTGAWLGSTAPTVGSKTSANSIPVVIANDQGALSVAGPTADGSPPTTSPVMVAGFDGTNVKRLATDSNGILYDANIAQAIARARVSNAFAQSFFGEVTTSAATKAAINATAFTEQTAGAQRSFKSTSANDTSAGTGARTIKITYFTLSGSTVSGPSTETVTLNGTTAVNTVATDICFVEKIEVMTVGSTGSNVGTLNLFSTTAGGGSIIASIAATDNITKLAHHYVASGRTCMIYDVFVNNDAASGNNQRLSLEALDLGTTAAAEKQILAVRMDGRSQVVLNPYVPTTVVGPARINAYITPENNPSQVTTVDVKYVEV